MGFPLTAAVSEVLSLWALLWASAYRCILHWDGIVSIKPLSTALPAWLTRDRKQNQERTGQIK